MFLLVVVVVVVLLGWLGVSVAWPSSPSSVCLLVTVTPHWKYYIFY